MPEISRFYGIIICLVTGDHNPPHIHDDYSGDEAVFDILTGTMAAGKIPTRAKKMVQLWISMHHDELVADWNFAVKNQPIFKITPLK